LSATVYEASDTREYRKGKFLVGNEEISVEEWPKRIIFDEKTAVDKSFLVGEPEMI
jgi:hypothetical protein